MEGYRVLVLHLGERVGQPGALVLHLSGGTRSPCTNLGGVEEPRALVLNLGGGVEEPGVLV